MCGMARKETTRSGDKVGEQPASPPGVSSHADASEAHPMPAPEPGEVAWRPVPEDDELALPLPSARSQKPHPRSGAAARDSCAKAPLRSHLGTRGAEWRHTAALY